MYVIYIPTLYAFLKMSYIKIKQKDIYIYIYIYNIYIYTYILLKTLKSIFDKKQF